MSVLACQLGPIYVPFNVAMYVIKDRCADRPTRPHLLRLPVM